MMLKVLMILYVKVLQFQYGLSVMYFVFAFIFPYAIGALVYSSKINKLTKE